jgi:hypothetical protein
LPPTRARRSQIEAGADADCADEGVRRRRQRQEGALDARAPASRPRARACSRAAPRPPQSEADKKKAAADAAINSVLFQEALSKKDIAKRALEKAAAKAEKEKKKEPEKRDIYTDTRDAKREETMEDWDDEKLKDVVNRKAGGQGQRCATDIICKHFLAAVENRQYGWFWECPNGGDKCQYRHALPEDYVLKRDRDPNAMVDKGPTIEDTIEEQRKGLTGPRTPVTFERLQEWLAKKQAAARAAEEAEMDTIRARYTKTGKTAGVTGRQLFQIDASLFVDDAAAGTEKMKAESSDEEDEEGEPKKAAGGAAGTAPPAAPPGGSCSACSSGAEPSYSANYSADGGKPPAPLPAAPPGDGAALPDLDGVDESLFLDDELLGVEDEEVE